MKLVDCLVQLRKNAFFYTPLQDLDDETELAENNDHIKPKMAEHYLSNGVFSPFSKHQAHERKPIYQEILDSVPRILSSLEADPYAFSASLLKKWVEVTLANDYVKGLEFGKKLVELFETLEITSSQRSEKSVVKFSHIIHIVHLLLYPTVYDDEVAPIRDDEATSPVKDHAHRKHLSMDSIESDGGEDVEIHRKSALETILRNAKTVVPMIKLEYRFQKLLCKHVVPKSAEEESGPVSLLVALNEELTEELSNGSCSSNTIGGTGTNIRSISVSSNQCLVFRFFISS